MTSIFSSSSSSLSTKEAVIFILDTSISMLSPYGSTSTRLECAKEALITWISNLMIQSKQNEVAVVVCKTATTHHHLDENHFPNLTVLPKQHSSTTIASTAGGGLTRPTISLLQEIQQIQCSSCINTNNMMMDNDQNQYTDAQLRGDLMDALVVATDAMRRRTLGKSSFRRSIVMLTDARHDIVIDDEQVLQVVDALRQIHCKLHIVGLDFVHSAVFNEALPESEAVGVKEESGAPVQDGMDSSDDEDNEDDENVDDTDLDNDASKDPREIERFLISVARLTGGSVQAAHSLHEILQHQFGKRIPTSIRRKCELRVAPSMDPLLVRVSLLVSKTNIPTLKRVATLLDENDEILCDGLGNPITSELERTTDYFDFVHKSIGIDETHRTRAVKYGTDWIPLNEFDLQGLKEPSEINITILGYVDQSKIGWGYRIGPPYAVSGGDSTRSCAALAALALGMDRLKSCAIGTFVKTRNADPILVALFPRIEGFDGSSSCTTTRAESDPLVLLQLPFSGDVPKLVTPAFHEYVTPDKQAVCDDLIEALLLPPNALDSTKIPNPAIRSFHRTVAQRAIVQSGRNSIRKIDGTESTIGKAQLRNNAQTVVKTRGEWFEVANLDEALPTMQRFRDKFFSSESS